MSTQIFSSQNFWKSSLWRAFTKITVFVADKRLYQGAKIHRNTRYVFIKQSFKGLEGKKMYWYVMILFCMFCLMMFCSMMFLEMLRYFPSPWTCFGVLPQKGCPNSVFVLLSQYTITLCAVINTTWSHERGTPTLAIVSWNLKSGSRVSGSSGENWASDRKLVAWTKKKKETISVLIFTSCLVEPYFSKKCKAGVNK